METGKTVLALVRDVFFAAGIQDLARRKGFRMVLGQDPQAATQLITPETALLILDLHDRRFDPLQAVRDLKANPVSAGIPLLGFVSHVETALRAGAEAAGCDVVVPRSALAARLSALLDRLAAGHDALSFRNHVGGAGS